MRKISHLSFLVLLLLVFIFPGGSAIAQNSPGGPVYIVQEGDSLWDIAARFHVSKEDLASVNGITDPDQIAIGLPLVIPGLAGLQGTLTTAEVPYGETLSSLSQRYHLSEKMLRRLNHLTSPNELYVGYSLVVLESDTPAFTGKRLTVGEGQSLLELSILNGVNPWAMLADNGLGNSWAVLPGDVLRLPGEGDGGPGALPPDITTVRIDGLMQGDTTEILVQAGDKLTLSGSLMDHPLNFFPGNDGYVALQGVHAMAEPGAYPLLIQAVDQDGLAVGFSQPVLIQAGDFPYDRSLPVDPATLDPETNRVENEIWSKAASPVSPEKRWNGIFTVPVEPVFAECYSSRFGNRRSYNGGAYLYFHTGLDFCGQVGDPIYAAAPGKVVFTGELTVRGNATMIDHGWGVYTAYMHQSEILVKEGDMVEQGQLIGRVGNTGRVEGPHLHFEVLVGGVQVDPLQWLSREYP